MKSRAADKTLRLAGRRESSPAFFFFGGVSSGRRQLVRSPELRAATQSSLFSEGGHSENMKGTIMTMYCGSYEKIVPDLDKMKYRERRGSKSAAFLLVIPGSAIIG